ncbi:MAG TPA: class I SAM-dependent methyltransferase [Pyrinomonadaceae bacterium]
MSRLEILSDPKAVSMGDEWFQFATADHFWMQWRHHILARALKRAKGPMERALEIGCGHGVARDMLERDFDLTVDGCDLNRMALEMAKPGKGRLFVYDILEQSRSLLGRYDAVFLLDVIEHIPDDAAFLIAASRHLRAGGLLVINVPANMWLASDYDRVAGHLRRYTRSGLIRLLDFCGIETRAVWQWGLSMVPLLLARKALLRRVDTKEAETILRRGFVPPNRIVRLLLHGLKNIETSLPFPMPFGTSILALGRLRTPAPRD